MEEDDTKLTTFSEKEVTIYTALSCFFCTIVVIGNVTFQKFIYFNLPFFGYVELSAGVMLYPITFLISDLITEHYGKKKAEETVLTSFLISIITSMLIVFLSSLPASNWSPVSQEEFAHVLEGFSLGTSASITAIYFAQLIDIKIFLWLKTKTQGRHLWLRNNISTIISQFVDTTIVLLILTVFGILDPRHYFHVFISSMIFKIFAAIIDTPFCYLGHFVINKYTKNGEKS